MLQEASRVAKQAAQDPLLSLDDAAKQDVTMQEAVARARDIARRTAPELLHPSAESLAAGARGEGPAPLRFVDPSDPNFRFKFETRDKVYLWTLLLVLGPLIAYHFSLTVRGWTDEQLAKLRAAREAKYGPPAPKSEFLKNFTAPVKRDDAPTAEELLAAKKADEERARAREEAWRKRREENKLRAQQAKQQAEQQAAEGAPPSKSSQLLPESKAEARVPSDPKASQSDKKREESAAAAGTATVVITTNKPGEQPILHVTPKPPAELASATAATAAAGAKSAKPLSDEERMLQQTLEALQLLQLSEQLEELRRAERALDESIAAKKATAVARVPTPQELFNTRALEYSRRPEPLPATRALEELRALSLAQGLPLPPLPAAPRWSAPPRDAAEARDRLQALTAFRHEFEQRVVEQTQLLQERLDAQYRVRIASSERAAEAEFETQLPMRMKALELSHLREFEALDCAANAAVQRDVRAEMASRWERINADEVASFHDHLLRETEREVAKHAASRRRQLEPELALRIEALEKQAQQVRALQKDLSRSAKIEATGARVHRLTNLLVHLEEALRIDEHKSPLFRAVPTTPQPANQQPSAPKSARDLPEQWSLLLEEARQFQDKKLLELASAVPLESLTGSGAAREGDEETDTVLPSLATLRHRFNRTVEPAARTATFLPAHVPDAEHSLPAWLYARVLSALTLSEGQSLRALPPPSGAAVSAADILDADAAHLSNASFYLNRARDLPSAVAELEQLSDLPRRQAEQWITHAKQRVHVERVFGQVRQHVEETAKSYANKRK